MEQWKKYKLGDIITIKYGKDHKVLDNGIYPVYGSGGVMRHVNKYICKGPSLLIPRKGSLNNIFFVDRPFWSVDTMFWTIINQTKVIPQYLYYAICKYNFSDLNVGSAVPSLTIPIIKSINVKIPPLNIQKKIADILKSLDDKIELNRRINDNLEQQAQALFKSWFVDFEPFKEGKFVDSELGLIPEGWRVGSIYTHINVIYGSPYKSSLFNDKGDGFPLIRIRDLKTFSPQFYTPELLPNTEFIEFGDVVAGMDAEFIPCLWLGGKGVLNQRCCKFSGKTASISNYYIMHLLKPELEFVQSYKTGTTVSHLGKSDIDRFVVINPPIDIIFRFSETTDSLLEEKVKLAAEIINLSKLRDTLLPKLMSGELKINDLNS